MQKDLLKAKSEMRALRNVGIIRPRVYFSANARSVTYPDAKNIAVQRFCLHKYANTSLLRCTLMIP